ncbi:MAG: type II toxin-antitoxin system RelE/ParE family toxin [Acidobacteria bacterium]|nr:type II toxin-antitoxin system RelE/ParE family toxin [Acidobacteriota bacterium]
MPRRTRYKVNLSDAAVRDFQRALDWSVEHFGKSARLRYARLISQAIQDIGDNPKRPSSRKLTEPDSEGLRAYHIGLSREYVAGRRVGNPRHVLIYVFDAAAGQVDVVRILHDTNEIRLHIPDEPL